MPKRTKTPAELAAEYDLDETDKFILKIVVEHPSITDTELSAIVKLDRKAVNARRRKKAFQAAVMDFHMPARERIQSLVDKAARKYQKLLNSQDEKVVRNVAKDILISESALKQRVNIDAQVIEPLIIKRPMAKEVIEIGQKPKELPKGEKE